jgi:mannose-6-phosphate isomerase-like protein (cupin superfamily)
MLAGHELCVDRRAAVSPVLAIAGLWAMGLPHKRSARRETMPRLFAGTLATTLILGAAYAASGFQTKPLPLPAGSIDKHLNAFDKAKSKPTTAGSEYWFVDKQLANGKTLKMSVVGPHTASHAPHFHVEDEFFFVLEGEAEFFLAGERRRAGAMTSLYAPSNVEHGIRNVGDKELRYLVIKEYPKSE